MSLVPSNAGHLQGVRLVECLRRVICFINLHRPLHGLDQAKKNRQQNNRGGNPKSKPPLSTAPILPPLFQRLWLRLVKNGFEYTKPQSPVFEIVDLPLFGVEIPALSRRGVENVFGLFLQKPLFDPLIRLGKKKCKGPQCFIDEVVFIQVTVCQISWVV